MYKEEEEANKERRKGGQRELRWNEAKKVTFMVDVVAWEAERDEVKAEKRRKEWDKPKWKDYGSEHLLPRLKSQRTTMSPTPRQIPMWMETRDLGLIFTDTVPQSIQSIKNTILQVPPLTKKAVDPNSLLAKLRFSDADKKAASEHIDSVGLDSVKFTTGEDDQSDLAKAIFSQF
ncbi:hypothetical protein B0H16DRAFT_1463303 [Mycena metata]|uniref:Uncharacterized protein n=1 Tax=Mycena metata TaxID=1033252 RepID=A0AAD7N3V8_9AGAR|nr:hypothetical protein B0H16DRAFT_1463303 [Mycena metata]